MKRLLVLAVVFAIASGADATVLSWSVDAITMTIGGTAVVQLIADDNNSYNPKSVGADPSSIAKITNIVALPAAGPDAVVDDQSPIYPDWWTVMAWDYEPPYTIESGPQWNVTIQAGSVIGTHTLSADYYMF
ncbi:MAG: hypothetical protein ACYSSO_11835, partial [Planctomycetota bacterium]